jgi:phospholipid-translocating ATPase
LTIDKLQDNVASVIHSLREAGIQIWMLTGDKIETATCIAVSAGLKSRDQQFYFLKELYTVAEAANALRNFYTVDIKKRIIMIDGTTLDLVMSIRYLEEMFLEISTKAPCVCVCRCSPTQKALIVRKINEFTGKRTAAVGDGGNDVGMILEACVGIGIVGKEGK